MTSENVSEPKSVESAEAVSAKAVDDQLIDELVHRAQAEGLQLTGEGGLLQQLTNRLLGSALEGEITDHLGYDKHDHAGKNGGNSRSGKRSKTVLTDVGPVEIIVPRCSPCASACSSPSPSRYRSSRWRWSRPCSSTTGSG